MQSALCGFHRDQQNIVQLFIEEWKHTPETQYFFGFSYTMITGTMCEWTAGLLERNGVSKEP